MAMFRRLLASLGILALIAAGLGVQPVHANAGPATGLFVINGFDADTNRLYAIDPDTAARALIGTVPLGEDTPNGLTDDGSTLYTFTVSPDNVYSIDPLTAASTLLHPFRGGFSAEGSLAYHADSGLIFALCSRCIGSSTGLYSFAPGVGAITTIGALTLGGAAKGNVNVDGADFRGDTLYGVVTTDFGGSSLDDHLVTIDTVSADITDVGPLGVDLGGFDLAGLAYDAALDVFYLISSSGTLYSVEPSTGAATRIGETRLANVSGATFIGVVTPPEPNEFSCLFPEDAEPFRNGQRCIPGNADGSKLGGIVSHGHRECRYFYGLDNDWTRIRPHTNVPDGATIAVYCRSDFVGKVDVTLTPSVG